MRKAIYENRAAARASVLEFEELFGSCGRKARLKHRMKLAELEQQVRECDALIVELLALGDDNQWPVQRVLAFAEFELALQC